MHAFARHPRPPVQTAQCFLVHCCLLRAGVAGGLDQPGFQARQRSLGRLAAVGAEEVDADHLGQLPAQARDLSSTFGPLLRLRPELVHQRVGFLRDHVVVGIACGIEQSAHLLVREPIDEPRLAQRRFAAAADDFLRQPSEILLRLLVHRQGIDRTLDGDRPHRLQPPPDLDPEIRGLWRQLINQKQPRRARRHRHALSRHLHDTSVSYIC